MSSGGARIDTCPSDFDTALEVFTGGCANLTSIACNDDSSACANGNRSSCSFPCAAGTTYFIWSGGNDGTSGNLQVRARVVAAVRLLNPTFDYEPQPHIQFEFDSAPGVTYVVQDSSTLNPANWRTEATIPGDGTRQTFVQNHRILRSIFYRVVAQ